MENNLKHKQTKNGNVYHKTRVNQLCVKHTMYSN